MVKRFVVLYLWVDNQQNRKFSKILIMKLER